jgi:hypothetical protein
MKLVKGVMTSAPYFGIPKLQLSKNGGTVRPLRWMENLHQSTWDHGILNAERSLKNERFNLNIFVKKYTKVEDA